MSFNFNTIDDFEIDGKTVLIRIDINSPVDPSTGTILDDTRERLHAETLKELETILMDMESSDINLDKMMENYKRALFLYKELEKYLNDYKKEIKLITETSVEDFNTEDDE